jgi:hypothetical protein
MAHRFDNRFIVRRMHAVQTGALFHCADIFRHWHAERITLATLAPVRNLHCPEPLSKGVSSFDLSYNAECVWEQKADNLYSLIPALEAGFVQGGQC